MKAKIIFLLEKVLLKLIERPRVARKIKSISTPSNFLYLKNIKNVILGDNIKFGENTKFNIEKGIKRFNLGNNFSCRSFCTFLIYPNANLTIGDNVFLNNYCSINCLIGISIGENSLFGEGVKIYDHNHKYKNKNNVLMVEKDEFSYGEIKIGSNCWIGSNVTILKGVTIGNNVIIGAGCVVYKSIPANSIVKQNSHLLIELIKNKKNE